MCLCYFTPACGDDSFLSVPDWIICHYLGMSCDVLGRQVRQFVWLCMDSTQRFQFLRKNSTFIKSIIAPEQNNFNCVKKHQDGYESIKTNIKNTDVAGMKIHHAIMKLYLEIVMSWKKVRKMNHLMRAPLRWHDNASNLLHLWIVWRTDSI